MLTRSSRLEDGKFPLIALKDVGPYSLWVFDNVTDSAVLALKVVTDDDDSFADIAATFTGITGKKTAHRTVPLED